MVGDARVPQRAGVLLEEGLVCDTAGPVHGCSGAPVMGSSQVSSTFPGDVLFLP